MVVHASAIAFEWVWLDPHSKMDRNVTMQIYSRECQKQSDEKVSVTSELMSRMS